MDENSTRLIGLGLEFISKAFWPFVVIFVVVKFRSRIEVLLDRLGSVKVAGSEWLFQLPAAGAPEPAKQLQKMQLDFAADGFLTSQGLQDAVSQSQLLDEHDIFIHELLIFDTPNQKTWLVVTKHSLVVLLDDPETRRSARLIQTFFDKYKALPIAINAREKVASFKFNAEGTWWFYGLDIYPTPKSLQDAIGKLVTERSPVR